MGYRQKSQSYTVWAIDPTARIPIMATEPYCERKYARYMQYEYSSKHGSVDMYVVMHDVKDVKKYQVHVTN